MLKRITTSANEARIRIVFIFVYRKEESSSFLEKLSSLLLIVLTIGPRNFSPIVKRLLDDGDILDGHGHRSSGSGINALTHQERLSRVEHIAVGGEGSQALGDIELGQDDLGIQAPPVTIEYTIFIKSPTFFQVSGAPSANRRRVSGKYLAGARQVFPKGSPYFFFDCSSIDIRLILD
jgi:hypothetical protein